MITLDSIKSGILNIPELEIPEGATAIIGPNGSGKTTLLRLIAGIDLPTAGRILIDNNSPRTLNLGWVDEYPDRSLLFSRVYDEIASPSMFQKLPQKEIDKKVRESVRILGIPSLIHRDIRTLSGGEQALVSLATAMGNHPEILVLDEFDAHLDRNLCEKTDEILAKYGCRYVIRCTQRMDMAATARWVIYVESGTVRYQGSPAQVFPHLEKTEFHPIRTALQV